jgi:hypothetical protein
MTREVWWTTASTLAPVMSLAAHSLPVWIIAVCACAGPVAYICRQIIMYKLTQKAIEKAPSSQMAAIMQVVANDSRSKLNRKRVP